MVEFGSDVRNLVVYDVSSVGCSVSSFCIKIIAECISYMDESIIFILFYFILFSPVCTATKSRQIQALAERFKTRTAHFPLLHDKRTGLQRATLGKSGSEAAPQL